MAANQTLLWLTDVGMLSDRVLAAFEGWLSESERQRRAGFVRPLRARQFIVGRALLRIALGRLLGVAPQTVVLAERLGRAPVLVVPGSPVAGFSISHSGPWVACAASTVTAVGIDVERIDEKRDVLALAEQALGQAALQQLHACTAEERAIRFYRMWCAYEAKIKLGGPCAATYPYMQKDLALALCSAAPLHAAPPLELVIPDVLR